MYSTTSRSRSGFLALVAIAASAFACAFERLSERIADGFHSVMRFLVGIAAPAPIQGDKIDVQASRKLTAASSFVKRIVKRERPRLEARWAMCPST